MDLLPYVYFSSSNHRHKCIISEVISESSKLHSSKLQIYMTGGVTRAHFLSALFVRVIVQRPNISSYREI